MREVSDSRLPATILTLTILAGAILRAEETPGYLSAAFDANRDHWEYSLRSENYAGASASSARFDDRVIWPQLTGKEAFVDETWEPGRVVEWAHPGEDGDAEGRNPFDPANWLLDGSPADRTVSDIEELFNEVTDVLFPASANRYVVNVRHESHDTKGLRNQIYRNITVGEGASLKSGGDGIGCNIYGNVWVKRDAVFYGQGVMVLRGDRSVFFRNDNGWGSPGGNIYQSMRVEKDSSESVEFLGDISAVRSFTVRRGTGIVGMGSRVRYGFGEVEREGTLALLDSGIFSCRQNRFTETDVHVGGSVSGGLPERPLAKDAWFAVSFKNHEHRRYDGPGKPLDKGRTIPMIRVPSMVIKPTARFESHAAPSGDAKLIVTSTATDDGTFRPAPDSEDETQKLSSNPNREKFHAWYDGLPHGISVFVSAEAVLSGIGFDHIAKGGIVTTLPPAPEQWSDVEFGEESAASGKDLFLEIPGLEKDGSY